MNSHQNNTQTNQNHEQEVSRLAVASFVVGIIIFISLFSLEKILVALIFGLAALRETSTSNKAGRGFAIFGIALSILALILMVFAYLSNR